MTRENGFYWVQVVKGTWEVVEHHDGEWCVSDEYTTPDSGLYAIAADRLSPPSYTQPWTSFIQDQMNLVFEVIDPNIRIQQIAVNRIIARDYSVEKDVTQPYLCQQFELPEEGSLSPLYKKIYEFFKKTRANYQS